MGTYTDDEIARRQIKVGLLKADGWSEEAIAKHLDVSKSLVHGDLVDMEMVPPQEPGRNRRPIRHGTDGGWQAHRRRREFPCQACSDAHTVYLRARAERAS